MFCKMELVAAQRIFNIFKADNPPPAAARKPGRLTYGVASHGPLGLCSWLILPQQFGQNAGAKDRRCWWWTGFGKALANHGPCSKTAAKPAATWGIGGGPGQKSHQPRGPSRCVLNSTGATVFECWNSCGNNSHLGGGREPHCQETRLWCASVALQYKPYCSPTSRFIAKTIGLTLEPYKMARVAPSVVEPKNGCGQTVVPGMPNHQWLWVFICHFVGRSFPIVQWFSQRIGKFLVGRYISCWDQPSGPVAP